MKEYLVPTGDGEAQFIERRSRFIGHIFLTETEEEALARLKQMREQYWDATHNVYAYIIRDGATRFSDDGEPGGTAGMPVLQVLLSSAVPLPLAVLRQLPQASLLLPAAQALPLPHKQPRSQIH